MGKVKQVICHDEGWREGMSQKVILNDRGVKNPLKKIMSFVNNPLLRTRLNTFTKLNHLVQCNTDNTDKVTYQISADKFFILNV